MENLEHPYWRKLCHGLGATVMEDIKIAKPEILRQLVEFIYSLLDEQPRNPSEYDLQSLIQKANKVLKELKKNPGRWAFFSDYSELSNGKYIVQAIGKINEHYDDIEKAPEEVKKFVKEAEAIIPSFEKYIIQKSLD